MMRAIREGFAWAWRSPDVRLVLLIVTVVSTVGFNFHVILPLLASDTLNTGPEVFGILSACFGGGALVGALLSATLGRASWKALVFGTGGFSVSPAGARPADDGVGVRDPALLSPASASRSGPRTRTRSSSCGRPTTCAAAWSASTSGPSPDSRRSAACSPAGSAPSAARSSASPSPARPASLMAARRSAASQRRRAAALA